MLNCESGEFVRLPIPDWKWACIAASCLLGIAAFIVFVIHPGGFEDQGVWYFILLPGSIPSSLISDVVYKIAPRVERVVDWALFISFNFGWYWGISYAAIGIFRRIWPEVGVT
jgi:hypothetical protein